ncbi:MAG: UDP-N-acetylmuramoyl-tripeptide--D-alanyl-D-alanine ligase [Bacteroidales bacterium]|nr:UDP-N-acetylmuramoyl-tripeptide--D-alanyl-D-alanine ligase [Bacteroidales bacterium]
MDIPALYERYLACGGVVTTDSRTLKGGELFFALRGENFDGNAYALKALDAGARYAVVSADSAAARSGRADVLPVPDTLEALQALARYHRESLRPDGRRLTVLGLTGTNGKTTTKELIRAVLATRYAVSATEGNLNNDIGVPLTLLKITPATQLSVVEMGANHPDDIARLVQVCEPDLGLITNVGCAHLLGFGNFAGVKRAKGQLYDYIAARGGEVFLNTDDPDLSGMVAERSGLLILPYGLTQDHAAVLPAGPDEPFLRIKLGQRVIRTRLVGSYNAPNVMAALAVGARFGVPVSEAADAIAAYVPVNNRSQMTHTERNTLIVDAYNANPSSMAAALDNFAALAAPRKIALLGDMRELGDESLQEHCTIVRKALSADYQPVFVGEEFGKALAVLGLAEAPAWFPDAQALSDELKAHPVRDAVILIKGSRGIRMENVVPEL